MGMLRAPANPIKVAIDAAVSANAPRASHLGAPDTGCGGSARP
jgi:hypothetical protein